MNNFLKVLLVGFVLMGLSSVAGATEWKTVELPKGVSIKVDVPTEMVALELEKGNDTDFSSIFVNQFLVQSIEFFKFDRFFVVMLNILVTSIISIIFVLIYTLAFKIKEKV